MKKYKIWIFKKLAKWMNDPIGHEMYTVRIFQNESLKKKNLQRYMINGVHLVALNWSNAMRKYGARTGKGGEGFLHD